MRQPRQPIVIAHRGASGYRPEHTLASYRLGIALGADYVEPDLVSTKDGVLVARHEADLTETTDVAEHPEWASRLTTKEIDGKSVTGWFVEDFTLAELNTLRVVERLRELRPQNCRYDGAYEIPTFEEILGLVAAESARLGRPIGVYPETKHPAYFAALGLGLEEPLVDALSRHGYGGPDAPVFVQSFEPESLQRVRSRTAYPLVQLVSATGRVDLVTATGLRRVATWADALGVDKALVRGSSVVADAHAAGLLVHVWTLRGGVEEALTYLDAGVDGLFTDHPDTAVAARQAHASGMRIHAAT
jgi:glycerophosphoryl diester phosphodiesterase